MNRREFLVRAGALAATPIVIQIVGCGDDGGSMMGQPTDRFSFTGTGSGHTHTGVITCTQLNGGMMIRVTSSVSGGHSHPVDIDPSDLATIMSGGMVTINTVDQHPHSWTISKPAGVCP